MKKILILGLMSFFFVSWDVKLDPAYEYSGKKEDWYGVKQHGAMLPKTKTAWGFEFQTDRYAPTEYSRHRTFEKSSELKEFLRRAPQETSDFRTMEINEKSDFEATFK